MTHVISVREYARLTTDPCEQSLDRAQISTTAFDYLCQINAEFGRGGASLVQVEGRRWLRLDNHVGVIQTPCGTTLEILPKHHDAGDSLVASRQLLCKMIQALLELSHREVGQALLEKFNAPLTEWVMYQFLLKLDQLVKRGMRFDYLQIEEELPFLRGQMNTTAQLRQQPGRAHFFQVRHDVFVPDRAENRLLRLALDRVRQATTDPDNWRLAQELSTRLSDLRASTRVRDDFKLWGTDRLMVHYQEVRPWCELILSQCMPMALVGAVSGLSLLFPMEKLFEHYVAAWLRNHLPPDVRLKVQASDKALCEHEQRPIFQLEPDLLVTCGRRCWVLDTKWKCLDAANRAKKYDLQQSDFYQMLAYGQHYMGGQGDMALIYPRTAKFRSPLSPFAFSPDLRVHVLPCGLSTDELHGWEALGLEQKPKVHTN